MLRFFKHQAKAIKYRHLYPSRFLATEAKHQTPIPPDPPESFALKVIRVWIIGVGSIVTVYTFVTSWTNRHLIGKEDTCIIANLSLPVPEDTTDPGKKVNLYNYPMSFLFILLNNKFYVSPSLLYHIGMMDQDHNIFTGQSNNCNWFVNHDELDL